MVAFRNFLIIPILGFLLASCSSAKLIDSWTNQDFEGKTQNIYIIGMIIDDLNRMLFENTFKNRLKEEGIKSTPSHYDFSKTFEDDQTTPQKMQANGCDSFLLISVINQRIKSSFTTDNILSSYTPRTPPRAPQVDDKTPTGRNSYYKYWTDYGSKSYQAILEPSNTTQFIVLMLEIVLYDLQTDELIWSARIETNLESDRVEMMQKITEEIVKALKAESLI